MENLSPPALRTGAKQGLLLQIPQMQQSDCRYSISALMGALTFTALSTATIRPLQSRKSFDNSSMLLTNQNFNGPSGDLRGDAQGLEKGGLLRSETSVLGWHSHITRSNSTGTGSSWHLEKGEMRS